MRGFKTPHERNRSDNSCVNYIGHLYVLLTDPSIEADPVKLQLVFDNILKNAVIYSKDYGDVDIYISCHPTKKDLLLIKVADQGIGIPPSEEKQIFDPFIKSSLTPLQFLKNKGLGLALCKNIITLHKGEIWAENNSHGANLCIAIPFAQTNVDKRGGKFFIRVNNETIIFSEREMECITLLVEGKSIKSIAEKLGISNRTVEAHINNIKIKAKVSYKNELIALIKNHSDLSSQ